MGIVPLWTGGASAEELSAVHQRSLQDLWPPFREMDQVQMTHCRLEPLVPVVAPLAGHHLYQMQYQVDKTQQVDKMQSFGSVAVLLASVVVLFLAVVHFVAAIVAAVAFAGFVAVAPGSVVGDTAAAFAAVVAVVFDAAGFGVAANVVVGAFEVDAVDATVVAVVVVDDDASVAAASGVSTVADF